MVTRIIIYNTANNEFHGQKEALKVSSQSEHYQIIIQIMKFTKTFTMIEVKVTGLKISTTAG